MKFTHTGRVRSLEGKQDRTVSLRKHKSHWVTPEGHQFRERSGAQIGGRPVNVLDLHSLTEIDPGAAREIRAESAAECV